MGGTLAQNCPREELELELEPLRSAAALRAFEGKAFTVVAFDFGFLAFSRRLLLTFSCTIPGIAKSLFCFNSFVAMMGSASSTRSVFQRCSLICRQQVDSSSNCAGAKVDSSSNRRRAMAMTRSAKCSMGSETQGSFWSILLLISSSYLSTKRCSRTNEVSIRVLLGGVGVLYLLGWVGPWLAWNVP